MTDTTLYLPEHVKKDVRAAGWFRPPTGSQFDHLPPGVRATATPLLLHRLKQFGVSLPKLQPVYDRILVYPLGAIDKGEEMVGGGVIHMPERHKDKLYSSRGLVVRAGMGALEQLWSHGIELGHIVVVARLSPWEREFVNKDGHLKSVMILRTADIVGSEDLEDDLAEGCIDYEEKDGRLCIGDRKRADPPENDEGI